MHGARWGFDMDWYLSLFRNLWVVGGLIGGVLFVIALSAFGSGLSLEDWRNLVFVLAGLIGLPLALWRSGVAANQVKVATRQVELSEAGQNTDRYQKGASMLGDNRLSVRQAGVFGLTELAKNNFEDYHATVMKLLCSFIKDRSEEQRRLADPLQDTDNNIGTSSPIDKTKAIAADCETALTSLSDLSKYAKENGHSTSIGRLDLEATHLVGVALFRAALRRAYLADADLRDAYLIDADLRGAFLYDADLRGADLVGADLTSANLTGAKLKGADLERAVFNEAIGLTSEQLELAKNYSPDILKKLREAEKAQKGEAD